MEYAIIIPILRNLLLIWLLKGVCQLLEMCAVKRVANFILKSTYWRKVVSIVNTHPMLKVVPNE